MTLSSGGKDVLGHQTVRDCLKCTALLAFPNDSACENFGQCGPRPETISSGPLGREGVSRALADQTSFILRSRNDDVGSHLSSGGAGVHRRVPVPTDHRPEFATVDPRNSSVQPIIRLRRRGQVIPSASSLRGRRAQIWAMTLSISSSADSAMHHRIWPPRCSAIRRPGSRWSGISATA